MPTADISPVHVIGGGPAGLATAAALKERGVRAVVLERGSDVGSSWRHHYERLRLHTTRRWSALPGLPIPRSAGRWVPRDEFVAYLERYARHHRLELAAGVAVSRVEAEETAGWRLTANGGRILHASAVVVATGNSHSPRLPEWPGREEWSGTLLHAAEYRDAEPFRDRDVLVVGVGNTGADIAVELAALGAARVRVAVRTSPHIMRRSTLGWPAQAGGVLTRRLPLPLADGLARPVARTVPNLGRHGLPRPAEGLHTRARGGSIPVIDTGLVRAVRRRKVEIVAAPVSFTADAVRLADGEEITPDTVIAATGYRTGLEELVGHLGVLDDGGRPLVHGARTHPAAPGLRFTGYTNPISGMLREIARDAPRVAEAVAAELAAARLAAERAAHPEGEPAGRRSRRARRKAAAAEDAAGAEAKAPPAESDSTA
ncbi:flavin-containing monooxygenase [Streptomyces spiramenti]|uniref:NAD(P)/FAD-dependent oxidoreductase n=1 Tax=Streptomyces spiramenti TaxID=2720606 RepID=A0ABX1APK4_9ACTN|nr:NAD(P)/FAD-dependent oxidoreductase [Streptomyces spiramenti]NJP69023.1 NAD(P)/FAD-dependent oxidoreductase [Streptomyces spiramenti]